MLLNKFQIETPNKRVVLNKEQVEDVVLEVFDTSGAMVLKKEFSQSELFCDLSHLSGQFLLRFFAQDQVCSEPISL